MSVQNQNKNENNAVPSIGDHIPAPLTFAHTNQHKLFRLLIATTHTY